MKKMLVFVLVAMVILTFGLTVKVVQAQDVCPAIWNVSATEVTISWSCVKQAHLYLDGQFVQSFVDDQIVVGKDDFVISLEVVIDPDSDPTRVFLTWNELFGTSTPTPTPTVEIPIVTPTPTDVLVCPTIWNVSATGVTISWSCVKQAHLYLDGQFVQSFVDDQIVVGKDDFVISLEVVIDPDSDPTRVFLTWNELFGTSTPTPTPTVEVPIVTPTATPVASPTFPTPTATPPISCSVSNPAHIEVTNFNGKVTLDFGECAVGQTHVYVNDQFVSNHINVNKVTFDLTDDVESVELVFGPEDLVVPIRWRFLRWQMMPFAVLLPYVYR